MGAVAHLILLVIFFALASHRMTQAFKLPPASKLLLILAIAAALAGIVLATRRGRRFAATRLLPSLRSAAASLRTVAASPVKLTLLVGGSALIGLVKYPRCRTSSTTATTGHGIVPCLPGRLRPCRGLSTESDPALATVAVR